MKKSFFSVIGIAAAAALFAAGCGTEDGEIVSAVERSTSVEDYTLTVRNNTGGSVEITPKRDNHVYMSGETVTAKAIPDDGYSFAGWSGAKESNDAVVAFKLSKNATLTARFEPLPPTLSVYVGIVADDGSLVVELDTGSAAVTAKNPDKNAYVQGEPVTVTADTLSGYRFVRWEDERGVSISRNPAASITVRNSTKLTAVFEPIRYKLTLVYNQSVGTVTLDPPPNPKDSAYAYGVVVTARAEPKTANYAFTGWSGASTEKTNRITFTITGDAALTANFTPHIQDPGAMPDFRLVEKFVWLKNHVRSNDTYILEVDQDETITIDGNISYPGASNVTVILRGIPAGGNRTITLPERIVTLDTIGWDTTDRKEILGVDGRPATVEYTTVPKVERRETTLRRPMFTIHSNVTFVLEDVTLRGHVSNKNALVAIEAGGVFRMNSGSNITGNSNNTDPNSTFFGSGVYIDSAGLFEMNGGTIAGNNTTSGGGGVFIRSSGTFRMSGGTIAYNQADVGGGVYAYGSFYMSGGTITGNNAARYGGGVYAVGIISKTGGKIIGAENTGNGNWVGFGGKGAAVYVNENKYWDDSKDENWGN